MKATVRRYLRAAGSILDIAPSTDYSRFTRHTDDYQSLKNDFHRIGNDFSRVIASMPLSKSDE